MTLLPGRFRAGLVLVLFCAPAYKPLHGHSTEWPTGLINNLRFQTPPAAPDFEMKIVEEKILVRRRGSQHWKEGSEFNEPVAVGWLDGNQKIYVVSKVIQMPKAKHRVDPDYPPGKRGSGRAGHTLLHIVVDDKGTVRSPTVDTIGDVDFTKAAVEAVKKWIFEPAKLNGQPIAVLILISMDFRTY